jgi:D-psicose/D-tagatose/L-ribulose 3-epimerase
MIKYGINTFTWVSPFRTQDLPLLDKAKALGFDLFEIPIEGVEDIDYAQAAEAYRRTGLECSVCAVMGASRDPAHEDAAIQRGGVEYLKQCIDATARMGGKKIGGPIYAAVGRTWQATPNQRKRDLERCVRNLRSWQVRRR